VRERHYAAGVQKRQQQLEADLRSMWANDQTGTIQVQTSGLLMEMKISGKLAERVGF